MIFLCFAENSIQLVPDGTLFLHIALILVMVFVLNATLFKPINRILEERERRTRGRSGSARDTLRSVEEKMSLYERTLRDARSEGYRLMEQERATALRERQIKLDAGREEIGRSVAEQKDTINAQVESARETLKAESVQIAAEIGAHILHRPVSPSAISGLSSGA
ncbi:MAG: ATP synthase F0 subunit B [Acidobacteria bacterium]|nr:ATP synthase F0 subunit B [Acidobacteriota bacterium]